VVLGNTPQEKTYGRQIVGRRIPVPSRGGIGRKAGHGRFSEWIIDRGPLEIFVDLVRVMTPMLERKLLERDIADYDQRGVAMTFIVHASRGDDTTTTIRLSVVVAIARGRVLAEEGWDVFITGPDGVRYHPFEFEKLLSFSPALQSRL
jgi:hypothetical protein